MQDEILEDRIAQALAASAQAWSEEMTTFVESLEERKKSNQKKKMSLLAVAALHARVKEEREQRGKNKKLKFSVACQIVDDLEEMQAISCEDLSMDQALNSHDYTASRAMEIRAKLLDPENAWSKEEGAPELAQCLEEYAKLRFEMGCKERNVFGVAHTKTFEQVTSADGGDESEEELQD